MPTGERDGRYSLGLDQDGEEITAESAYTDLASDGTREAVIHMARMMAELTLPSVFPPEGYRPGDNIPGNSQSLGAWCVNSLASNLMFMALPAGRPMMRFEVIEHRLQRDIEQDPELYSKVELGLARLEQEHRKRAQTTSLRSAYVGAAKQLIVAGNVLWKHLKLASPTYHRVDTYVVQRDSYGNQLLVIHEETLRVASLDKDIQDIIMAKDKDGELKKQSEWERTVEIYTVCKLHIDEDGEKTWCYWQEYKGELLPDTDVVTPYEAPPMYAAWLIPVYGESYGRSYCEEYRGDLYTVENHGAALNDGAAAASLVLTFVKPGARTTPKQVREAENLSVLSGAAEDVTVLTMGKSADFQFVANNFESAARRLSHAFMLAEGIRRDAERVTAEEIGYFAMQLDKAMGGLYSELALSFQRNAVQRFVALHEEEDESLPILPEGLVQIGVVTGIDALGRSTEAAGLMRLGASLNQTFGPGAAAKVLHPGDFARRMSAAEAVNPRGLVKTSEDLEAEQQRDVAMDRQRLLIEKGTGPAVGGLTSAAGEQIAAGLANANGQQQELEGEA